MKSSYIFFIIISFLEYDDLLFHDSVPVLVEKTLALIFNLKLINNKYILFLLSATPHIIYIVHYTLFKLERRTWSVIMLHTEYTLSSYVMQKAFLFLQNYQVLGKRTYFSINSEL
jgi:hypothetical protein